MTRCCGREGRSRGQTALIWADRQRLQTLLSPEIPMVQNSRKLEAFARLVVMTQQIKYSQKFIDQGAIGSTAITSAVSFTVRSLPKRVGAYVPVCLRSCGSPFDDYPRIVGGPVRAKGPNRR